MLSAYIRYQFVLVYTVPAVAKDAAVEDVTATVAAGAVTDEQALPPILAIPQEFGCLHPYGAVSRRGILVLPAG